MNAPKPESHGHRDHAEVGSSSAKGYLACVEYKRETRPKKAHPVTLSGTRCHEALDSGNMTLLEDEAEIPLVEFCIKYYEQFGPYTEVKMEERLYVINDDWFGYYDRLCFKGPELAHLFDWKFGYIPVSDAEYNPQGWFFVIGCFDKYPELQNLYVHFPQPRIGEITRHLFTRARAEELKTVFMMQQDRRERHVADGRPVENLSPSYENCKYCGNLATCEAIINLALKADEVRSKQKQTALVVPDGIDAKLIDDPDTLRKIRDLADITLDWADNAKWHVGEKRLQQGIEIPGYKLVSKRGHMSVSSPMAVYQAAVKAGLTAADIATCSDLSVSKLKKLIAKNAPPRQGRKMSQLFEDELLDTAAIEIGPDSSYLKREN